MATTDNPTLPSTWSAPSSCVGSTGYWYVVYATVNGGLLFENMYGIPTPSQLSKDPSGLCAPPSFTSDVPYVTDGPCPTGYSAACATEGEYSKSSASMVTCCPSGVFNFICTNNVYGCFNAPDGVQTWIGSRTDYALEFPTAQQETHTAGDQEGLHAWGIRMIVTESVKNTSPPETTLTEASSTATSSLPDTTTSSSEQTSSTPAPSPPSQGLSAGVAAGIGVGVAAGVIIAAIVGWVLYRRHMKKRSPPTDVGTPQPQGMGPTQPEFKPQIYPGELEGRSSTRHLEPQELPAFAISGR